MRAVKIGIKGYRYVRSESKEKEIVHVELEGRPKVCPRCGSSNVVGKAGMRGGRGTWTRSGEAVS